MFVSSSELTPLGQVVGADLHVLSRIQSALHLHRKHEKHYRKESADEEQQQALSAVK